MSEKELEKKKKFDALKKRIADKKKGTEETLPDVKEEADDQEAKKLYNNLPDEAPEKLLPSQANKADDKQALLNQMKDEIEADKRE